MKHLRLLSVACLLIFVCSVSLGQGITDIDRTKKTKKERKVTPSNPVINKPTQQNKKKVKRTVRKTETVFSISSETAQFGASGGSKTFTINSNNSWTITAQPLSWGHLSRKGNELTLRVDANRATSNRTDYFELSSGSKTLRVDITQSGENVFSISSNKAVFSQDGGIKSFSVSSNDSWQIKANTRYWGHLTREGNVLTLKVDPNTLTSNRTDYFEISSENKTIRVEIFQSGGTTLALSADQLNFSSSGGTQTITVSTNESWEISLGAASWGHLTKRGNQLIVTIDANNNNTSRSDYFRIRAGSKTAQVNISQSGSSNTDYSYKKNKRQQRHNRVMANGGYVKFGLEIMDFGIGTYGLSSKSNDVMALYYNIGASVKFGNYMAPVQLEIGAKPGVVYTSYDTYVYDSYYNYSYGHKESKSFFHMPVFTKLKINICTININGSKFYIAGIGTYNAIRDKNFENEFSAGGGLGFAWKKWDWFTYYKQDIENKLSIDTKYIGTSFVRYF